MARARILIAVFLLTGGAALAWLLADRAADAPRDASFKPAFELLGRGAKTLDRALSRAVPVNELDEKEFGDAIALRYGRNSDVTDADHRYVNGIVAYLAGRARRPFLYRAFIVKSDTPNAFALPGGIVLVTRGLLAALGSESELAAIVAHEMGHIERGHCFDAVRFELLARKTGTEPLGKLADFAMNLMLRHGFSKSQEAESDEYAFEMLCARAYDPGGVAGAFGSLIRYAEARGPRAESGALNPFRDYFATHPDTAQRRERYEARARGWRAAHYEERRYTGVRNLAERRAFPGDDFPGEWNIVAQQE